MRDDGRGDPGVGEQVCGSDGPPSCCFTMMILSLSVTDQYCYVNWKLQFLVSNIYLDQSKINWKLDLCWIFYHGYTIDNSTLIAILTEKMKYFLVILQNGLPFLFDVCNILRSDIYIVY